jgi:hypothetical protein
MDIAAQTGSQAKHAAVAGSREAGALDAASLMRNQRARKQRIGPVISSACVSGGAEDTDDLAQHRPDSDPGHLIGAINKTLDFPGPRGQPAPPFRYCRIGKVCFQQVRGRPALFARRR